LVRTDPGIDYARFSEAAQSQLHRYESAWIYREIEKLRYEKKFIGPPPTNDSANEINKLEADMTKLAGQISQVHESLRDHIATQLKSTNDSLDYKI